MFNKKKTNFFKPYLLNDLHKNVSILFLTACDFFAVIGIITQYLSQSTIQKNYLQNQTYKNMMVYKYTFNMEYSSNYYISHFQKTFFFSEYL